MPVRLNFLIQAQRTHGNLNRKCIYPLFLTNIRIRTFYFSLPCSEQDRETHTGINILSFRTIATIFEEIPTYRRPLYIGTIWIGHTGRKTLTWNCTYCARSRPIQLATNPVVRAPTRPKSYGRRAVEDSAMEDSARRDVDVCSSFDKQVFSMYLEVWLTESLGVQRNNPFTTKHVP